MSLSTDFFSKLSFSNNSFMNSIRVSNGLDPDQAPTVCRPDLGPNHLLRLSADDIPASKERVVDKE